MTDIEKQVRSKLAGLKLAPQEYEEVIAEIAGHLELMIKESYGDKPSAELRQEAVSAVRNWTELTKEIQHSKGEDMRERLRKMWLPALGTGFMAFASQGAISHISTGFLSFAAQGLVKQAAAAPKMVRIHDVYLAFNLPWLVFLIFCGAFGAFWSRMSGGTRRDRLVAALAPAGVMGTLFLLALVTDVIVQVFVDHRLSLQRMAFGFAVWTIWMVIIPAIPLLVGAAPFLRAERLPHTSGPTLA